MENYRILDANLNRFREGLRVLEDICRFEKRSNILTSLKGFRHQLKSALSEIDETLLLKARRVEGDPGRKLAGSGEYQRKDLDSVFKANMKRAQESARVLEEIGKIFSETFARVIEKIRYGLYELEVAYEAPVFPSPCLYVLISKSLCKLDPEEVLLKSIKGGASVIQLREKDMEDGAFLEWIKKALSIAKPYGVPVVANDRIHLAQLCDVAGVHLGQGDLSTEEARRLLGAGRWIGRSTHEIAEAKQAKEDGVDYIGVGPLYPTLTKQHAKAVGLSYLDEVHQNIGLPYVGIGSVNRGSLDEILKHRPTGLAICTGVISSDDPEGETRFFKEKLEACQ